LNSVSVGFCFGAHHRFMMSCLTWVASECEWALCAFACVRQECERVGLNVCFLFACFRCRLVCITKTQLSIAAASVNLKRKQRPTQRKSD
jgi:hypothetical protein